MHSAKTHGAETPGAKTIGAETTGAETRGVPELTCRLSSIRYCCTLSFSSINDLLNQSTINYPVLPSRGQGQSLPRVENPPTTIKYFGRPIATPFQYGFEK